MATTPQNEDKTLNTHLTEEGKYAIQKAVLEYDYIRFAVADLYGVARGVVIPAKKVAKYLESGLSCYSGLLASGPNGRSVIPQQVLDSHCGNGLLVPDHSTLHPLPWLGDGKYYTGQFLSEMYWDLSTPQEACTRNIAHQLIEKLGVMGLEIYSGMELEFSCMDKETGKPVFSGSDGMAMLIYSEFEPWFTEVEQNMSALGVKIETMHTESGPGQFEFATTPEFGIRGPDVNMMLKQGIKEMATKRGWQANFMAKYLIDHNGSGAHFNFSLWHKDTKKNAFLDENSADGLSDLAKHWIGGMMEHASAVTALCCITTNCYLRLHNLWCPHQASWGIQDRVSMLRVKNDGPSGTYFENRVPSALFNPYLVMAATIAAGLDGVLKKTPCPKPHDVQGATVLPRSLEEAVESLQKDEVMVEAMGKTFIDWFVQCKKEIDLKAVHGVTDKAELLKIQTKEYARLM